MSFPIKNGGSFHSCLYVYQWLKWSHYISHYIPSLFPEARCFSVAAGSAGRGRWRESGRSVSETDKTWPGCWTLHSVMQEMCLAAPQLWADVDVEWCRCLSHVHICSYMFILYIYRYLMIFIEHRFINHYAYHNVGVTLLYAKGFRLYMWNGIEWSTCKENYV